MLRQIARILAHGGIFVPLLFGELMMSLTLALLLAVFYIKTMKLGVEMSMLAEKVGPGHEAYGKVSRLRRKWQWITFIPDTDANNNGVDQGAG